MVEDERKMRDKEGFISRKKKPGSDPKFYDPITELGICAFQQRYFSLQWRHFDTGTVSEDDPQGSGFVLGSLWTAPLLFLMLRRVDL